MAGWGLVGLARRLARAGRPAAGSGGSGWPSPAALAGLAYGALLDLSVMVTYGGEQSLDRYLALSARGIPFNVAHAAGNFAIALAAGPALVRMISRYRTRLEFSWRPAGAAAAGRVAGARRRRVWRALGAAPSAGRAAPGRPRAASARWLARAQNADGGFGADARASRRARR